MRSLSELLLLEKLESTNLLEQVVWEYLRPELSYSAIEKAKFLSKEELILGLEEYIHFKTLPLWKSLINKQNLTLFLNSKNEETKSLAKDYLEDLIEIKKVKGKFNLQSNTFKFNEELYKDIFQALSPSVDIQESEILKQQFSLLEESHDQWIDASLEKSPEGYKLIIGEVQEKTVSPWAEKMIKTVSSLTLASLLFSSVSFADDSNKAIDYATKAVMAQPEVKEIVDKTIDSATKEAEKIVQETGTKIPVTIIGYGVKVVRDKAVKIQGKSPLKELPMDYSLAVGLESYSVGLQGDNPLVKDSKYWLQNTGSGKENKIELGIKFDF